MLKKLSKCKLRNSKNLTYKLVALIRHEKIIKLFIKTVAFKMWHVKRLRAPVNK